MAGKPATPGDGGPSDNADQSDDGVRQARAFTTSRRKAIAAVVIAAAGALVWLIPAAQDQVTRLGCVLSTSISIQTLPLALALLKQRRHQMIMEGYRLEAGLKVRFSADDERRFATLRNERLRLEDRQDREEKALAAARLRRSGCVTGSGTAAAEQ